MKRFLLLLFYRQFYLATSSFGKRLDKTVPTPTTSHQHPSPSTSTHNQPKYIHHQPPPAKIYPPPPPLPEKWTTIQQKPKYIHIKPTFDIVLTVSFSSKCSILSVTEILWNKVLISSFFKFPISTTFSNKIFLRCFEVYIWKD